MRYLLGRQYESDRIYSINGGKDIRDFHMLRPEERERIDVIAGHFGMDFCHQLNTDFCLFTLLRDPVDRIISHYDYVRRMPTHEHNAKVNSAKMSLVEYALCHDIEDIDNGYVRQLSGLDFEIGQCTDAHLEKAKHNFSKYVFAFGLTERFYESVEVLASKLNWDRGLIDDNRRNVTPEEDRSRVNSYERDRLAERNRFDVELYKWASRRLVIN